MLRIVTANTLRSGAVVYLADDGRWVETLAAAAVAVDGSALQRLERLATAAVESNEVTAVYAMDVVLGDLGGAPRPVSVREVIRAARGPSI